MGCSCLPCIGGRVLVQGYVICRGVLLHMLHSCSQLQRPLQAESAGATTDQCATQRVVVCCVWSAMCQHQPVCSCDACPGAGTQQGGRPCFGSVIATYVEQRRWQACQQPRLQDVVLCCQLYILMQPSSAVCVTSCHMYLFEGSSAWTVQHAAALLLFSTRANAGSACAYSPGDAVWWHTD